jgi:beta-mannosidase
MFACARYPAFDRHWLKTVRIEAEQQVRRLRHHACLALWCGNNECEKPDRLGPRWKKHVTRWSGCIQSWSDYRRLFDDLLADIVSSYDPDTAYWPASPHTPVDDLGERENSEHPDRGDAHVWGTWFADQTIEDGCRSRHRFVSEVGFQALPHPHTLNPHISPTERNLTSPAMDARQKCDDGNTVIATQMSRYFRMPHDWLSTIYTSQVLQALVMETQIEHWRRNMDRTRGVLYWQLNDCWPGTTWASMDYNLRPKALQHCAKHFFSPLLITSEIADNRDVIVIACSDAVKTCDVEVCWRLMDVDGHVLDEGGKSRRLRPDRATHVTTLSWGRYQRELGAGRVIGEVMLTADHEPVSQHIVRWTRPRMLELVDPALQQTTKRLGPGQFQITLQTQRPALWVWLTVEEIDAAFSDNFIHVMPGRNVKLNVTTPRDITRAQFDRQLRLINLFQSEPS